MENIVENNILLAEFLGWETNNVETITSEEFRTIVPFKITNRNEYFTTTIFKNEDLLFHNDWRWLMEVVNKIETVETKDGRTFTIDMHMDSVLIFEYALTTNEIVFTEGQGRFENLYSACIQFVKWYNENKY